MLNSENKLLKGVVAAFLGQLLYIVLGLLGNIILARILSPNDFGQVAIVMFFIVVSNVLVEGGFGGALIRKNNPSEKDYSTVFGFSFLMSLFLIAIILIFAVDIANYYSNPILREILQALCLVIFFNSFQVTSNARLVIEMRFKRRSIYKLLSLLLGTVISVILALQGYGLWALVFLNICSSFFLTLFLLIYERTFKKIEFSRDSFKSIYSFGVNTSIASIINVIFDNIYQIIIGRYFSILEVGFYYQAKKLQDVSDTLYNIIISNVLFSHLSKLQSDTVLFVKSYKKIVLIIAVISSISVGAIVLFSDLVILIMYGKKWIGASFYLQVLGIVSFFNLQELVNKNIFKVFNKTKRILYLEIIKKIIQSISIIIGLYLKDIEVLLCGYLVTAIISYLINYYFSRKVINAVSSYELNILLKIILISTAIIYIFLIFFQEMGISGFYKFLFFPIVVSLQLFIFSKAISINVFTEVKKLISKKI